MNEQTKKVVIIVVVVILVAIAIFEGKGFVTGPSETTKEIGHGVKGQGMKAQEKADEAAAAQGNTGSAAAGTPDPLAGPGSK